MKNVFLGDQEDKNNENCVDQRKTARLAKTRSFNRELKGVVEPMGHVVDNYGMYSADDEAQLTYVQCGILASCFFLQELQIL